MEFPTKHAPIVDDYFSEEKRMLVELSPRGFNAQVIYDIGGSTGFWSDSIATVARGAEFHLFEPLSQMVDFYQRDLESRLRRLPNLHLHPIALGDHNGIAEMFISQDGWGSSLHDRGAIPEVKERVQVPIFRLDDYVFEKHLPPPDVIKIDTQGAEAVILKGAANTLKSAHVLFLETWLVRGYGPKCPLLGEIIEQLRPHGFTLADFGERFYDASHRLYSVDAFFFSDRLLATLSK